MKRTQLAKKGTSDTALIKDEIQNYVRAIVIIRDGGCIARNEPWHTCSGYRNDGELILQADHLITRGNGATYATGVAIAGDSSGVDPHPPGVHLLLRPNSADPNEQFRKSRTSTKKPMRVQDILNVQKRFNSLVQDIQAFWAKIQQHGTHADAASSP
jgi:hypothetical protein